MPNSGSRRHDSRVGRDVPDFPPHCAARHLSAQDGILSANAATNHGRQSIDAAPLHGRRTVAIQIGSAAQGSQSPHAIIYARNVGGSETGNASSEASGSMSAARGSSWRPREAKSRRNCRVNCVAKGRAYVGATGAPRPWRIRNGFKAGGMRHCARHAFLPAVGSFTTIAVFAGSRKVVRYGSQVQTRMGDRTGAPRRLP